MWLKTQTFHSESQPATTRYPYVPVNGKTVRGGKYNIIWLISHDLLKAFNIFKTEHKTVKLRLFTISTSRCWNISKINYIYIVRSARTHQRHLVLGNEKHCGKKHGYLCTYLSNKACSKLPSLSMVIHFHILFRNVAGWRLVLVLNGKSSQRQKKVIFLIMEVAFHFSKTIKIARKIILVRRRSLHFVW